MAPFEKQIVPGTMNHLGICQSVTKPVTPSVLLDAIASALAPPVNVNAPQQDPVAPDSQLETKSNRILVAEDNPVNRLVAAEILRHAGYSCEIAINGIEAVSAHLASPFEIILMDCQMPELDGFDATRQIRQAERQGLIAGCASIIALTANAVKGDRERCLTAGMDDYVSKPVEARTLIAKIQNALANRQPRMAAAESPAKTAAPELPPPQALEEPIDLRLLVDRCMGDVAFLKTILDAFEVQTRAIMEHLTLHLAAGDARQVAAQAHMLKGAAGTLGAEHLQESAAKVESAGKAGDLVEAAAEFAALEIETRRCMDFLPDILKRLPSESVSGTTNGVPS